MGYQPKFQLSAALTIPFDANQIVDKNMLISHAHSLLKRGCQRVTLGGTTGEGTSLSASEKFEALDALIQSGIKPEQIGVGVFGTDLFETISFIKKCLAIGVDHLLITQPFYFKNPTAQGITDWYDYIFTAIGDELKNVILYNIPSCTAIDLPHETIEFLLNKYGKAIIGLKESSGDKEKTIAYQNAFPNLPLYVGSETYLGEMVKNGAIGSISGCANFIPEAIYDIIGSKQDRTDVQEIVTKIVSYPITPAIKVFVAAQHSNPDWLRVRPPLQSLDIDAQKALKDLYNRLNFS